MWTPFPHLQWYCTTAWRRCACSSALYYLHLKDYICSKMVQSAGVFCNSWFTRTVIKQLRESTFPFMSGLVLVFINPLSKQLIHFVWNHYCTCWFFQFILLSASSFVNSWPDRYKTLCNQTISWNVTTIFNKTTPGYMLWFSNYSTACINLKNKTVINVYICL